MDAVLWGWCEFDGGSYDCELTLTEKRDKIRWKIWNCNSNNKLSKR